MRWPAGVCESARYWDESNGDAAFTDATGNTFNENVADIAGQKMPGTLVSSAKGSRGDSGGEITAGTDGTVGVALDFPEAAIRFWQRPQS